MSEAEGTGRPHRGPAGGPRPSSDLRQRASAVLPEVDRRLRDAYHTASLGNKQDPLDELIYIQLSIRTRESAYTDIYSALRQLIGEDWGTLLRLPPEEVLRALHAGGMAAVKLNRLRAQIEGILAAFGRVSLDPLKPLSTSEAEAFLRSLPGVGPKTARCVLMYSLGREVFPVDSHCRRVLARLGFLSFEIDRKAADDYLQDLVPPAIRHTLHVNLVHHGRELCLPVNPRCGECMLLDLCPTGLSRVNRSPEQG